MGSPLMMIAPNVPSELIVHTIKSSTNDASRWDDMCWVVLHNAQDNKTKVLNNVPELQERDARKTK